MKNYLKLLIFSMCICYSFCSCGNTEESNTSAPVSETVNTTAKVETEEPATAIEYKSREELAMDFEREYLNNRQSGDVFNADEYEKQKEEYINTHYIEKPTEAAEIQEDCTEAKAKIDEFHALIENYENLVRKDFSFDVWLYVDGYKAYDEWQMYAVNDEAGTYKSISTANALEYGKYKLYIFYENEKTGIYYFNVSDEFTLDESIEDYDDNGKTEKRYYFNLTDFMGDLTEKTLDK